MSGTARAAVAVVVVLILPACTITYTPDGVTPSGQTSLPFELLIPIDGELQASTNPQFAWNPMAGAISYHLQISTASDFSTILWDDSTLTITSTFLTQVTLTNFTTYYWRIYGVFSGGATVLAGGSPFQFRTQGGGFTTPIPFATLYPGSGLTMVEVDPLFAWQASNGASSYTIEVDTTGAFNPPLFVQTGIHLNRGRLPGPLANNTPYYWRVLATGQLGNRYSDVPVAVFTTAP